VPYSDPASGLFRPVPGVETIAEAYDQGWRVTVRFAWGPREGMKRRQECVYGGELDMLTLVWTRGRDFPLGLLESRLRCPRCGSRRVRVAFTVPATPMRIRA
jgi:hypothetical protein